MHELALADAVVRTALQTASKEGITRLTRIVVRIGELQQITTSTFEWALSELMPASEPRLAGARVELEIESARFRCRPCGNEFGLAEVEGPGGERESEAIHFVPELAHGFLACPGCDSPDFEVLRGRGVVLQTIEGDR